MMKQCAQCSKTFLIDNWETNFYKHWHVPEPLTCPDCRRQLRLAFRGINFYMRQCDLCAQPCMSFFSPKIKGYKIYCNTCWQSDAWDGFDYGRDFDFSKPFFEQFYELYRQAPKHASNAIENENSQYIISAHRNKNCYVGDEYDFTEDSFYGHCYQYCKDVCDCAYVYKCELGYELIKCENCYHCAYAFNSYNCADSYFLINCRGVKNSILCNNLRNVEYSILNKPVSPEEFNKEKARILSGSYKVLQSYLQRYQELKKKTIYPHLIGTHNQFATGNYLTRCQSVVSAYNCSETVNARYINEMQGSKDAMDIDWYQVELGYQSLHVGPEGYDLLACLYVWFSNSVWYSNEVHYSQDIFGSCSLKKQKQVIFNKPYAQADYFKLRDKIVEHMKATGEWGQFFPKEFSLHGYNQTFAKRVYPLTNAQAKTDGWNWIDDDAQYDVHEAITEIPDNINDVDAAVCKEILLCQACQKPYKIVPQELAFYKRFQLPLPRSCFESRNEQRFKQLGPQQLWNRKCMCTQIDHQHTRQCPHTFATTFQPDGPEIVYCNDCYVKTVN